MATLVFNDIINNIENLTSEEKNKLIDKLLSDTEISRRRIEKITAEIREDAKRRGLDKLTLEEINEFVHQVRAKNVLKIVLDTNILLSSYLSPQGSPSKLINRWYKKEFQLIVSIEILAEYHKIMERFNILHKQKETLFKYIHQNALHFDIRNFSPFVLNDPDDDKFIHCAIEGKADYIVSGDKHLLKLKQHGNTQIVTVKEFLDILDTLKKEKK